MAANEEEERIKISFDTNADQAKRSVDGLNASLEVTNSTTEDLNKTFEDVYGELKPLTARMGEAEDRLYELALAGQQATEEYKGLLQVVANYRRTQQETDRVVDAASTNLAQKLAGGAQIAATSVSTVTSGMALFGEQSEETEKALLKVQAAMAFADSVKQLSELGGQFRVFKTVVADTYAAIIAKKKAETAATLEGEAAQSRLNLTVLKNPYVLAGAAISAIVIATYAWVKANGEATKVQEQVTEAVRTNRLETERLTAAIAENKQEVDDANSIEVLRAKSLGATQAQLDKINKNQSINKVADASNAASEAFKNLTVAQNNLTKALKTGDEELITAAKEGVSEAQAFYKQTQSDYNRAIVEDTKLGYQLQIEANNRAEQARQKAEEKQKSEREKIRKEAEEESKKREEAAKKEAERIAKIREDANRFVAESNLRALDERAENQLEQLAILEEGVSKAAEIEDKAREEKKEKDEIAAQADKDNKQAISDNSEKLIQNIADLAGKNKAIQKSAIIADGAVSLGKAAVNTAEAVTKDLAKGAPFSAPLVALDLAVGATSAAAIIKNTNAALKAVGGGSAPTAPQTPAITTAAANPQTGFQASSENQIATSISQANATQQPIKAYVVGSEVTTQQDLDAKLVKENSFGG